MLINLQRPIRSERVRAGFQPHWRTVFVYRCGQCGKECRMFASAYSGRLAVPAIGAVTCPHCKEEN